MAIFAISINLTTKMNELKTDSLNYLNSSNVNGNLNLSTVLIVGQLLASVRRVSENYEQDIFFNYYDANGAVLARINILSQINLPNVVGCTGK